MLLFLKRELTDIGSCGAIWKSSYDENPVSLTPKEYALLELLVSNGRRIMSRSGIIDRIWSLETAPSEDTIESHIRGLRNKLRDAGTPEDFIETVHGLGYRMKQI
jgi:DNA-binding response OmpR family regulator